MRILRIGRIGPGQNPQFYVKFFFFLTICFLKHSLGRLRIIVIFFFYQLFGHLQNDNVNVNSHISQKQWSKDEQILMMDLFESISIKFNILGELLLIFIFYESMLQCLVKTSKYIFCIYM